MSQKSSQNNRKSILYLLDTNLLLIKYFFASPEILSRDGININGILPVLKIVNKLHKKGVVICIFDKCSNNFRKQIDINYKSNRSSLDPNLYLQASMLIEFLESINFNVDYSDIYEADDLIGSYTYAPNMHKILYTADKDLIQLIKSDVEIYNPFKKIYYDENYCYEKYQVYPYQFAQFLALCGDACDNITGIKNVGPKTAVKILNIDQDKWQINFPKYDFSDYNTQLKLTTIYTSVPMKYISKDLISNFEDIYRSYFL